MSRWLLIALFAFASPAFAAKPVPLPRLPGPVVPITVGPEHAGSCLAIYINENDLLPDCCYVPLAPGTELADDLHTRATDYWPLCAFDIGYQMVLEETVDATVTFYSGDPSDSPPGAIVAGPFFLPGLPGGGQFLIHHEVASGMVGPDVWMGVAFSSDGAGMLTSDPASIGFTHDRWAVNGFVADSPYEGNPIGSLYMGVYAAPPTGTRSSTWGEVKAIYR